MATTGGGSPPALADELARLADALAGVADALDRARGRIGGVAPRSVAPGAAGHDLGAALDALSTRLAASGADTAAGAQLLRSRSAPDPAPPNRPGPRPGDARAP